MQTLETFIKDNSLVMTTVEVPENPHMNGMPNKSRHFHCTISQKLGGGTTMQTYFSVGSGIVEHWVSEHGTRSWDAGGLNRQQYNKNRRTIAAQEFFEANAKRYPGPELADVLNCLASDSASVEQSDFEDWAADLGYDSDSRKALETYQICEKQAKKLRHLVGSQAFEELLYETECL